MHAHDLAQVPMIELREENAGHRPKLASRPHFRPRRPNIGLLVSQSVSSSAWITSRVVSSGYLAQTKPSCNASAGAQWAWSWSSLHR
jgi:hypothetical protein